MHACELAELAAIAAIQGLKRIRQASRLPESFVERYWEVSKRRLDRWMVAIQAIGRAAEAPPSPQIPAGHFAVLEEVLLSEPLTRVWAAVLEQIDRVTGGPLLAPVGRGVMLGHLEARHRVLSILRNASPGAEPYHRIDRLRRHSERWIDLLIAVLATEHDVLEYAVDTWRAEMFAVEFAGEIRRYGAATFEGPLREALRGWLAGIDTSVAPSAELNRDFASAVIACLENRPNGETNVPAGCFARLNSLTDDTQDLLDALLRSRA